MLLESWQKKNNTGISNQYCNDTTRGVFDVCILCNVIFFFFFEILAENIEMWDKQVEDEKVNWIFSWMSLRNRRVLSQQLWPESASELVISVPHCVSLFFVMSENKTTFSSRLWSISFGKEDGDHFVRTGELLWLLSGKREVDFSLS